MTEKAGLLAKFAGFCKAAYEHHYIPYLNFFYGGEYLHHGSEPVSRIADLPYVTVPEPRKKTP
ncbi:hypothetical protein ACFVYA_01370 [Amycolatopsis sp. NPDC058278]|jgi:hypothetical protein|uniref:hypothetical protein n=1 Tax=unclassified Amycolatopsis TaxID=2618356 RepID=UPI00255BD59A|nr:hypothetical protein [Amycolatopsis sp. DG1A-15b]WIX87427.1 hypothetical protein QRY02_40810 [Amycolatopsis sp. DG1A-15b]